MAHDPAAQALCTTLLESTAAVAVFCIDREARVLGVAEVRDTRDIRAGCQQRTASWLEATRGFGGDWVSFEGLVLVRQRVGDAAVLHVVFDHAADERSVVVKARRHRETMPPQPSFSATAMTRWPVSGSR